MLAEPALAADAKERVALDRFKDARSRAIADALYAGRALAGIEDEAARRLAAEIDAGLDAAKSYAREWRGVVARLLEARSGELCTKQGPGELQDSVVRKLRRLGLKRHEMSLDSGERAGDVQH